MTTHTKLTDTNINGWTGMMSATVLLAVVLAIGMVAFAPTAAADGHCDAHVDEGESIQAVIDAASAEDTICVDEGTYAEDVTADTEGLTLLGANAGIPGDGDRGNESTINGQVTLSADGVTLDGFTVTPPDATASGEDVAVLITDSANDVVVTNNIVRDFEEGGLDDWIGVEAIMAHGGDASDAIEDVTITQNLIHDIEGLNANGGAAGIMIIGNVAGATVADNVIHDIGLGQTAWAHGISITDTGAHTVVPQNVALTGNQIFDIDSDSGSATFGVGVGIEAAGSGYTLEGNDVRLAELGVEIKEDATVEILDSVIRQHSIALLVTDDADGAEITIRDSQIAASVEGVINDAATTIDAVQNYWGSPTGPDTAENELPLTGVSIQGDVEYDPWCLYTDCIATTSPERTIDSGQDALDEVLAEGQDAADEVLAEGQDAADEANDALDEVLAEGQDAVVLVLEGADDALETSLSEVNPVAQELLGESPMGSLVVIEGQGECRTGDQGASDESGLSIDSDGLAANTANPLAAIQASLACADAITPNPESDRGVLGMHTPDEGELAGVIIIADGSIVATIDLDPNQLAAMTFYQAWDQTTEQDRSEDPTLSAGAEGRCVYTVGATHETEDNARVTLLGDEGLVEVEPVEGETATDALFGCVLPALLRADTFEGGSYLAMDVNVQDGLLTVEYSTVPQTDALTALTDGEI